MPPLDGGQIPNATNVWYPTVRSRGVFRYGAGRYGTLLAEGPIGAQKVSEVTGHLPTFTRNSMLVNHLGHGMAITRYHFAYYLLYILYLYISLLFLFLSVT